MVGGKDTESGPLVPMAPPHSVRTIALHEGSAGGPSSVGDKQSTTGRCNLGIPAHMNLLFYSFKRLNLQPSTGVGIDSWGVCLGF